MIKSKLRSLLIYYYFNNKITDLPYLPRIANIELTNSCNYNCKFCAANGKDKSITKKILRKKSFMKYSDFSKIVSQYAPIMDGVSISHHGESLLHPKFNDFVKLLHNKKINYNITTNGSLLTKEKSKILVKYPPQSVKFSVYTTNSKLYSNLCVGGDINKVLKQIDYFLKIKSKKTKVIIRTLNIPYLNKSKNEFFKYFENKEVTFDLNVLNSWGGRVNLKTYDSQLEKHTTFNKFCIQPWTHLIIGSDLGIYICNNHEDKPLDNLKDKSIIEIWNSKEYLKIRQNIISGDYKKNKMCKYCDYYDTNTQLFPPTNTFFFKTDFLKKIINKNKDLTIIKK